MKLRTEIIEEKQNALIVSKKEYPFISLLKNELKRVSISPFYSPFIPKIIKMFKYIFVINETISMDRVDKNKNSFFIHIFFGKKNQQINIKNLVLKGGKNWDGKWRLFIFDIPEENRSKRDQIRKKLKSLGLYNIQRSVFAYPHDCREELKLISDYFKVTKYATYAETSFIDIGDQLRDHFKI